MEIEIQTEGKMLKVKPWPRIFLDSSRGARGERRRGERGGRAKSIRNALFISYTQKYTTTDENRNKNVKGGTASVPLF